MRTSRREARKNAFWAVAAIAAFTAGPAPGAEPHQLTTQQMKALSLREADRIVRDDLLSVLQPVDPIHQGRGLWLRDVGLPTRAFRTAYEGLCRRDVVRLRYTAATHDGSYADRPLRPYSVEADAQFALRRAPPLAWSGPEYNRVQEEDCERLSAGATAHWFDAPNDLDAARAVNILDATLTGARAGTLTPCLPDSTKCDGLSTMKAAKLRDLYRISSCTGESDHTVCYQYELEPAWLVTVVARDNGGAPYVSPDYVVSVKVAVFINDR